MGRLLSFWPGFTELCAFGRWRFFFIAVLFAVLLDVLLVTNFFWTEYLSRNGKITLLVAAVISWVLLKMTASHFSRQIESIRHCDAKPKRFKDAVCHYLSGNWFEAECLLDGLLLNNPRDVEAKLLLATLYRRTERFHDAERELAILCKYEECNPWTLEIELEKQYVQDGLKLSASDISAKSGDGI